MTLAIIAAVSQNGVIGRNGQLPWRLSADLRRFRKLTTGHPIIMGRRTWESIDRPLPGRTSIVVTRNTRFTTPYSDVSVTHDFDAALQLASQAPGGDTVAFAIGGAAIYSAALPRARRLYLTRVLAEVEGDAYFPPWEMQEWHFMNDEHHSADEYNDYPYAFEIYERSAS